MGLALQDMLRKKLQTSLGLLWVPDSRFLEVKYRANWVRASASWVASVRRKFQKLLECFFWRRPPRISYLRRRSLPKAIQVSSLVRARILLWTAVMLEAMSKPTKAM